MEIISEEITVEAIKETVMTVSAELETIPILSPTSKIIKENSLEEKGLAESNSRRQLKKLRDQMLVDKKRNLYRLSEFEPLSNIFDKKIQGFLIPQITERIKEYLEKL